MKVEPQIKQKRKSLRQKLKSTKKRRTQKRQDELTEGMLYDAQRLNEKLKEMQDLGKELEKFSHVLILSSICLVKGLFH